MNGGKTGDIPLSWNGRLRRPLGLRIASVLFVPMLLLVVMAPAAAWDRPQGNTEGCCLSEECARNKPAEECDFHAEVQDVWLDPRTREWGTYSPYPHAYLFQNAIRIFHEEGRDNWAEYLAQENHFQALADGASWADGYKGSLYAVLRMNFFWGLYRPELTRWSITSMAGFDHCYSKFSENPYGAGLENVDQAYIANMYLTILGPLLSMGAIHTGMLILSGLPIVGGLILAAEVIMAITNSGSLSLDLSPELHSGYPSAALLAEEHYNRAIDVSRYADPANRYWADRSPEENSLFELGWAAHFAQDMGVLYHLHDIWTNMIGSHNAYEAAADGKGDPNDEEKYYNKDGSWIIGRDFGNLSVPQIIQMGALSVYDDHDWEQAQSDDPDNWDVPVQKGLKPSEEMTAAILAKYLTARGIPPEVPHLAGRVVQVTPDGRETSVDRAYVFYKEKYFGDVDTGAHLDNETRWEYVRTSQGIYSLNLKEGTYYLIRAEMPGYHFAGYRIGELSDIHEIGDTGIKSSVLDWVQPTSGTVMAQLPLVYLLMVPDEGKPATGQSANTGDLPGARYDVDPMVAAILQGGASPADALAVKQALLTVRVNQTTLAAEAPAEPSPLQFPEEVSVEIELANLVDMRTGEMIQYPQQAAAAIVAGKRDLQNVRRGSSSRTAFLAKEMRRAGPSAIESFSPLWQFSISRDYSVIPATFHYLSTTPDGTISRIDTGYSQLAYEKILKSAPRQAIVKQDRIEMTDQPSLSYTYGSMNLMGGRPSLMEDHIARIPAPGATIEVSLTPGPGYIGPDFYDISGAVTGTGTVSPGMKTGSKAEAASAAGPARDGTFQPDLVPISQRLRLTTNAEGLAGLTLHAGTESGKIRLFVRVLDDPAAPGFHPATAVEFVVQPPISAMESGIPVTALPSLAAVPPRDLSKVYAMADTVGVKSHSSEMCIEQALDGEGNVVISLVPCRTFDKIILDFVTSIPQKIGIGREKTAGKPTIITPTPTVTPSPSLPLTASFTATPSSGKAPLRVNLDATASRSGDSPLSSYLWDFGDGQSGTGSTGSHTYPSAGTYTVRLTVRDSQGRSDSAYRQITVAGTGSQDSGMTPPEARFTITPTSGVVPLTVRLDASAASDPDGRIVAYHWDFGDGFSGTGARGSHTYTSRGTYTVQLTVRDNSGFIDSATRMVEVTGETTTVPTTTITTAPPRVNQPPVAAINAYPLSGYAPLTVSFNSKASYDADGTIISYSWDFGDGQTISGPGPDHTYGTAGTYMATLTVTDNQGATGQMSQQIVVVASGKTHL